MMFSTKAEYGVRVMVELAWRAGKCPDGAESVVPLAEIAEHDGMPLAYLEHLVARLRKAGLIDSRRASPGGCRSGPPCAGARPGAPGRRAASRRARRSPRAAPRTRRRPGTCRPARPAPPSRARRTRPLLRTSSSEYLPAS